MFIKSDHQVWSWGRGQGRGSVSVFDRDSQSIASGAEPPQSFLVERGSQADGCSVSQREVHDTRMIAAKLENTARRVDVEFFP